MSGYKGDDRLDGGNDILDGGIGNDRLIGDKGDDELFRDVGNDIFVFGLHLKHDQTDDFEGGAGPGM